MLYGQTPYWEAPQGSSYSAPPCIAPLRREPALIFSSSPGPFFPCASRMCGPHPLVCLTELGNMEINKASIRQESKARIGGWEECCLRLCPNPEMPEKAPGAQAALRLDTSHSPLWPVLTRRGQRLGATPFPHAAPLGCPSPSSLCHPTYTRRKESGLLALPFLSL